LFIWRLGTEISCTVLAGLTESIDPNPITIGWLNVGFKFVLKLDTLCLRHVDLENTVLPPSTVSLERPVHLSSIFVFAYVIDNC